MIDPSSDPVPFSYTDAFDIIQSMEENEILCGINYFGMNVWPILRMRIYFGLIESGARIADLQDPRRKTSSGIFRIWQVGAPFVRDLMNLPFEVLLLLRRREELYFSDGVSFLKEDGEYFERILGPYVERARSSGLRAELFSFIRVKRTDVAISSIAGTMRLVGLLAWIASFLTPLGVLFRISGDLERIARGGGPALNSRSILREFFVVLLLGFYFRIAFKISGIKRVYLNTYYHMYGWGACLGARKSGVEAIDVQHGVQGEYHAAYTRFPKACGALEMLPSTFGCWTEVDAAQINSWARHLCSRHEAVVFGHPLMERWLEPAVELVARFRSELREALGHRSICKIVFYTCTGERAETSIVRHLAQILGTDPSFVLLVRPHPGYLHCVEDLVQALEATNGLALHPMLAASFPLYGLMSQATIHVTTVSTTVLEAQSFGVPNLVLGVSGRKMYKSCLKEDFTTYVDNPSDISVDVITRLANIRGCGGLANR